MAIIPNGHALRNSDSQYNGRLVCTTCSPIVSAPTGQAPTQGAFSHRWHITGALTLSSRCTFSRGKRHRHLLRVLKGELPQATSQVRQPIQSAGLTIINDFITMPSYQTELTYRARLPSCGHCSDNQIRAMNCITTSKDFFQMRLGR